MKNDYINFENLEYVDELYKKYLENPSSIPKSWQYFFDGTNYGETVSQDSKDLRIHHLIEAYRKFGHLKAKFNPLELSPTNVPELSLSKLQFSESELQNLFPTYGLLEKEVATLKEIIKTLEEIYCHTVGIEFYFSTLPEMENWLSERIEKERFRPKFTVDEKKIILDQLNRATLFETFLHTKYVGQKRFSLEGGETLIPMLNEIVERGSDSGLKEFILGMSHRGRLNVLTNIFKKSYSLVFSEFEDFYDAKMTTGTGDVKYHKGFSSNIQTSKGHDIHLSLPANPSHLESIDPVVEGKTLAKQKVMKDKQKKLVLPIIIHGDASVSGQGVVYETLQLSKLEGYSTGGTIHIIINNQIGFTTLPKDSRSTIYASDIAKTFAAPVFHVNSEDPEGCIAATKLALEIRQKFHIDVFIDMYCYRKYGHNEGDEPFFTQPLQYNVIKSKKAIRELYLTKLLDDGSVKKEEAERLEEKFKKDLQEELETVKQKKDIKSIDEPLQGIWKKYESGLKEDIFQPVNTKVPVETLKNLAKKFCTIPKGFSPHSKVEKLFQEKEKLIESEGNIDWSTAEWLAFSSLLSENVPLRLAGQDSRRGTFSQRHAIWVDQKNGQFYFPLSQFGESDIIDSPLSEYAALGFEFGYSLSHPDSLVIWEAQYGDFSNGGQIVTDQYISSSEEKWQRYSGITLLLPHGYEGQGPEHSSGRLERFLQLCGNNNMQIVFPTMPAQYFHLLRRQVLRLIRKPLIIFTPKSLLRHPLCVSALSEFNEKSFEEIIDDNKANVTRVLFCSGKVYFSLIEEREKLKRDDVSIVRIEQLYPIHTKKLEAIFQKYKTVKEFFWVQEEPKNMGSWSYIFPILQPYLPSGARLNYVGRKQRAAPASGSHRVFLIEEKEILKEAFQS